MVTYYYIIGNQSDKTRVVYEFIANKRFLHCKKLLFISYNCTYIYHIHIDTHTYYEYII